jgi:hypothetical protein
MQDKQPDLVRPKSDCVNVSLYLTNDKTNPNECGPRKYLRITFASYQNNTHYSGLGTATIIHF